MCRDELIMLLDCNNFVTVMNYVECHGDIMGGVEVKMILWQLTRRSCDIIIYIAM